MESGGLTEEDLAIFGDFESDDDPESYLMDRNALAKGDAGHTMTPLPEDFVPSEYDVICGRGRKIFMHPGNERFRLIVSSCLEEYSNTGNKLEKSLILCDIVAQVRANSPGGGFVKKSSKDGRWYEVGDFLAREKTSQAFRDALHDQYKSSNTAKKIRRQAGNASKLSLRSKSTSQLDSRILGEKPKSSGYSDPLIARLRAQKSARSGFEFSSENGSRNALSMGGAPAMLRSCPNLARSRASTGTMMPTNSSGNNRNFDWGLGSSSLLSRETNSSTANFEWKAAQETKESGGSANFDWGSPKVASAGSRLSRINEVSAGSTSNKPKFNMFSKMMSVPSLDFPPQAQARQGSLESFDLDMNYMEPEGDSSSTNLLLASLLASPQKKPPALNKPSNLLNTSAMNIEAQLRALRKSTFETVTVPEHEPLQAAPVMEVEDDETFDRLVAMVGEVGSMGGDPFEPDPLP